MAGASSLPGLLVLPKDTPNQRNDHTGSAVIPEGEADVPPPMVFGSTPKPPIDVRSSRRGRQAKQNQFHATHKAFNGQRPKLPELKASLAKHCRTSVCISRCLPWHHWGPPKVEFEESSLLGVGAAWTVLSPTR